VKSASLPTSRLARFAILTATGVTALSLAACGSSNTSSPTTSHSTPSTAAAAPTTTSAPSPGPATPNGEARVSGLITSVAGNAVQVTQRESDKGNATVDFSGSTKVTETGPAALTDVTAGTCVSIRSQEGGQGGQPVTAISVRVIPAVDGKCLQANESGKRSAVQGSVAFVAGNTINVTSTDASGNATQTAVTVGDKTKYRKQTAADTQAISAGKCLTAKGTQDSGGAVQATTIDLRPAHDGKCAGEAGHHGHGG
jgi:Domain of unknown function (DUF5666)